MMKLILAAALVALPSPVAASPAPMRPLDEQQAYLDGRCFKYLTYDEKQAVVARNKTSARVKRGFFEGMQHELTVNLGRYNCKKIREALKEAQGEAP